MQADSRQLASESGLFRFRSAAVLLLLAFAATVVGAQEGDNEPKQYLDDSPVFVHESSPQFAMKLPKKSRATWKFVDLEARRTAAKEELELEKAKAKEETAKNNIQTQIDRVDKSREYIKMRLEMVGQPRGAMVVEVNPATTKEGIRKPVQKVNVPTRGEVGNCIFFGFENLAIEVKKATLDKNVTSKADQKSRREVYVMEGKGNLFDFEPAGNGQRKLVQIPVWFRIRSVLVYNTDASNRFRVNVLQMLPWEMAEDKKKGKKALKEMSKLLASLRGL